MVPYRLFNEPSSRYQTVKASSSTLFNQSAVTVLVPFGYKEFPNFVKQNINTVFSNTTTVGTMVAN